MHDAGYRVLTLADLPAQAWKNGGGTTRELACFGSPGAPFDCRFSIADIDADGPFSDFAGYDRQMVLLDGEGIRLDGPGTSLRLAPGTPPIAFSGDVAVAASLLAGPSRDFNVMTRRAACSADVDCLRASAALRGSADDVHAWCLIAWRGDWTVTRDGGACFALAAGQAAIGHRCRGLRAVRSDSDPTGGPMLIAVGVRLNGSSAFKETQP